MKQLLCGAAERITTPRLGLDIPGYFEARKACGVKSDLYTQAVVLDDGDRVLAVISVDILDFQKAFATAVRKRLAQELGLAPEAVLIAATHCHTGQPTNYTGFTVKKNTAAMKRLEELTGEAAVEAYRTRRPVRLRRASGREERISFRRNILLTDGTAITNPKPEHKDRIVGPLGEIDYGVELLCMEDEQGKAVCQIVNFACHPDVVGGDEYCADYPGELRRMLKERLGEASVLVYLNGCAGNINHIDPDRRVRGYRYPADHYKAMGQMLSETVLFLYDRAVPTDRVALDARSTVFRAKRRQPTDEQFARADEILKQEAPGRKDFVYATELKAMQKHPKQYEAVEVLALTVGDTVLVGLPGEIYADTGLAIKAACPKGQCMVASLANGTVGYVVTEPAFSYGVYETKLSRYNSSLSPDAADRMVAEATRMMRDALGAS